MGNLSHVKEIWERLSEYPIEYIIEEETENLTSVYLDGSIPISIPLLSEDLINKFIEVLNEDYHIYINSETLEIVDILDLRANGWLCPEYKEEICDLFGLDLQRKTLPYPESYEDFCSISKPFKIYILQNNSFLAEKIIITEQTTKEGDPNEQR